jgi:hypothetical protein
MRKISGIDDDVDVNGNLTAEELLRQCYLYMSQANDLNFCIYVNSNSPDIPMMQSLL